MKSLLKYVLALFYIVAGVGHFLKPEAYLEIMPPFVPYPFQMILLSGGAEMAFGVLLLFRRTQRLAAWGMIALLIAVFPANLHMAFHPDRFPDIPRWVLCLRLPLQGVLILWAYWFAKPDPRVLAHSAHEA